MPNKVLVIGLDGATFDLMGPWAHRGHLPNLRRLMSEGAHGILRSTIPWYTAPAWVSFATGKNPGKHGCYQFAPPSDSLAHCRPISSRDIPGKTFYELLSEEGKSVILINLPASYPPRIEGPVITSYMTKGHDFVFPSNLIDSVPELASYQISPRSPRTRDFREVARHRFACARRLFNMDWDFFFLLFGASDYVSHHNYAALCQQDPPRGAGRVFRDLDGYLGWFLDHLDDHTSLLVISDHGFQYSRSIFYVNVWLAQYGYVVLKEEPSSSQAQVDLRAEHGISTSPLRSVRSVLVKMLYNHPLMSRLVRSVYHKAKPLLPVRLSPLTREVMLEHSVAYAPSNDCQGIYINDRRRFKNGCVPESEVLAVREQIVEGLECLKNPYTGGRVFAKVWRKEELYSGDFLDEAPDILLDPNCCVSYQLPSTSVFETYVRNHHARNGILLAYGRDVVGDEAVAGAEIIDVAPTVLHMMGLSVPEDMDGRVLMELFKPNSEIAQRKVQSRGGTGGRTEEKADREQDSQIILHRLRGMGYLQ
jgi:predicted AlkP superfamily phosphohydrolase/phosphomutase